MGQVRRIHLDSIRGSRLHLPGAESEGEVQLSSSVRLGRGKGLACLALAAAAATIAVTVPGAAAGKTAHPRVFGHVYTETNDPKHNAVLEFNRLASGQLVAAGSFATGGRGGLKAEHGCTAQCPVLDAQNEVIVGANRHFLFAVNAGSNTISSFRIEPTKLTLVDQKPSGGGFPTSVTNHGNLLYVLNIDSLNIAGFRVSATGKLTPIKGSKQKLTKGALSSDTPPKEIQFDNSGHWLAVTLLNVPVIDTFPVSGTGAAGPAKANTTANQLPFAFSVDPHNRLVVAEIIDASIPPSPNPFPAVSKTSTYTLNSVTGKLKHIDSAKTNGFAACWTDITHNGQFIYVVNTGGGAPTGATVSVLKISQNGKLKLVQVTPPGKGPSPLPNGDELARFDVVLSPDNQYLYVAVPGVVQPKSQIDVFKVGSNGHITQIGASPTTLNPGISGLAAF